jgi:hypothetical protein
MAGGALTGRRATRVARALSPALVAIAVLIGLATVETLAAAKSSTPTSTTTTTTTPGGGQLWVSISPNGGFSVTAGPAVYEASGSGGPLGSTPVLRHAATRTDGGVQLRLYEGPYTSSLPPQFVAPSCLPDSQLVAEVSTTAVAGSVTFYGQSTPGIAQSNYFGVSEGAPVAVVAAQVPSGTKAGVVHFAGGPTVRATPVTGGWVVVSARVNPPPVVRRPVPLLTDTNATVGTFSTIDRQGHSHLVGSVRLGSGYPVASSCLPHSAGGASVQPRTGTSAGVAPPPALPAATGPPPASPAVARQQVEAAYRAVFTANGSSGVAPNLEGGAALSDAARKQLQAGYRDILGKLTVRIGDFGFLSPTQAALQFDLLLNGQPVTATTVGQAVLVNGKWKVARATFCAIITRASVPCG